MEPPVKEKDTKEPDMVDIMIEKYRFKEISLLLSNNKPSGLMCWIIYGFKLLLGDTPEYFLSHWKDLTGVGHLLNFLSGSYQVGQASLLQNMEVELLRDLRGNMYHFLFVVQVGYKEESLVRLLDFIQRTRESRNTGHVSVYQEVEIGNIIN